MLELGLGGDGNVDFFLPGDALLPPLRMILLRFRRPFLLFIARDFPFFPFCAQCLIELLAQRFQRLLELFPDDVDLGIVGDGLKSDMRHALAHESLADISAGWLTRWASVGDFCFLSLAIW
jgi:hypothetical protein